MILGYDMDLKKLADSWRWKRVWALEISKQRFYLCLVVVPEWSFQLFLLLIKGWRRPRVLIDVCLRAWNRSFHCLRKMEIESCLFVCNSTFRERRWKKNEKIKKMSIIGEFTLKLNEKWHAYDSWRRFMTRKWKSLWRFQNL